MLTHADTRLSPAGTNTETQLLTRITRAPTTYLSGVIIAEHHVHAVLRLEVQSLAFVDDGRGLAPVEQLLNVRLGLLLLLSQALAGESIASIPGPAAGEVEADQTIVPMIGALLVDFSAVEDLGDAGHRHDIREAHAEKVDVLPKLQKGVYANHIMSECFDRYDVVMMHRAVEIRGCSAMNKRDLGFEKRCQLLTTLTTFKRDTSFAETSPHSYFRTRNVSARALATLHIWSMSFPIATKKRVRESVE